MDQGQSHVSGETITLTLPPVLDIAGSATLRHEILNVVTPDVKLTFDSSQVEQLTTSGVQMLLAAAVFIKRKNASFKIANPSDVLIEAFKDLGLFSQIMAWDVE